MNFKEWVLENYDPDEVSDISNYGADAGWPHITYVIDCVRLYEQFHEEIWSLLAEDADNFCEGNVPALIASFGRADMAISEAGFKNLLVWYAVERTCREIVESGEWEDEDD